MFTIDSEARVTVYPKEATAVDQTDGKQPFWNQAMLGDILDEAPGSFAVKLWNQLPGVTPILTPKFRNKSTATERIWAKLCELYPDAILPEEMPKAKGRKRAQVAKAVAPAKKARAKTAKTSSNGTRKSAWAEELTVELRKRFKTGEPFTVKDLYKLIPVFQRKHKENNHIAARLRTTLAQDLRGRGIVKALKQRGTYQLTAA